MALRKLATKEENLIISCNILQGTYRPPPTQLVITYYETHHMPTCFDHQMVIFRPLKYTKLKLQLEIYFCRVHWDLNTWLSDIFGCASFLLLSPDNTREKSVGHIHW